MSDIGVVLAGDGTAFPTHGAKIIHKDEKGIYVVAGGMRVDIDEDALLLMVKQGSARLFAA